MKDNVKIHFIGGETLIVHWSDWVLIEKRFDVGVKMFQSFFRTERNTEEYLYVDFAYSLNLHNIAYVEKTEELVSPKSKKW